MLVRSLLVERLRIVASASIELGAGVNVFTGPNGSGKTSILEALHLIGTGRSFRATSARELVSRGESRLLCRGELTTQAGDDYSIGVEQGQGPGRIRCNGEDVKSASRLARLLPLVLVSPDSHKLLTDGSDLRRGIIDWAMFHVEHEYAEHHGRFRRALRQRNAGLRQNVNIATLRAWDEELALAGQAIHDLREVHLVAGLALFETFVTRLLQKPVSIRYQAGWDLEYSLREALHLAEDSDRTRGFTTVGPQRADLRFEVDGIRAHRVLSRGEGKLFVLAILLSQVAFLNDVTGKRCVVLLDELASELDTNSRRRVFDCLQDLGCQTLLTSVSPELVAASDMVPPTLFHVEQGSVTKVL